MAMATMNPAAGGPVGGAGAMMMMNNGSPAVTAGMNPLDPARPQLNKYIYDYLLKNGHYEGARILSRDEKFEFPHGPKSSPGRGKNNEMNGNGDGMDLDMKDEAPDDLPRPHGWDGSQGSGFLLEWFSIFSDLYVAHTRTGKVNGQLNPAAQYLMHEKNNQRMRENMQNQALNRPNMNNAMMQQMRAGAMNGKMPTGQMTQQQIVAIQQQQQRAKMMVQQQMARGEQPDNEMNGVRPTTPADGDAGGSPSKRPRIDGGQQNFQQGMMQNGRPGAVPNGPQTMMIQAGFNPAMNQQFQQRNGAMAPKGMQPGMANGMMNMANAGSPMMGGMNQFSDNMQMDMYQRPNMPPGQLPQNGGGAQSGNHALQDYQMQLMLLEQQNKKRLMMARQEQHENNPGGGMPGPNMSAGMSPNGSRTGTSPNPDAMKRTPGLGGLPGSPSAAEAMAGRSPGMSFMNNMQGPDFSAAGMFNMGKDQPMMGAGGPQGMRPPTSNEVTNAMRQQGGRPNQFQGGQPMQQQGSQTGQQMGTPGQRTDMPPPQGPVGANARNNGNSPSGNAPPTPSQTNKANPKKGNAKNNKDDGNKRQRPTKKGSTNNTNATEDNPAATPQPSTPITPNNPQLNAANKAQAGMQQNQHQPNQAMQMGIQNEFAMNFDAPSGPGGSGEFNLDFSTLENADVLENFDFDSFLNTSADDGFNFTNDVDLAGDFSMGQGD